MKYLFEVRIKPGYSVPEYARAWLEASRVIQRGEGACGTYLHRKIGEPDVVLAIAHWESKSLRDAQMPNAEHAVRAALGEYAGLCEFTPIGEFEDPEWMVEPRGGDPSRRAV